MKESCQINYRRILKIYCLTLYQHIERIIAVRPPSASLVEDWRASLDNKDVVATISLDLSKDCVPHGLLLAKLKVYGVAQPGIALMRNYLTRRSQRVKVGDNVSTWMPVQKGAPRGSVLGPFFQCLHERSFLLYGRSKY